MIYLIQAIAIAAFTFFLLQSGPAPSLPLQQPPPVVLTDKQDEYPLGLHLEILEDPTGQLTINDVTSPEFEDKFEPSQVEVPNYGFTNSAYWVRFQVRDESEQANLWQLEIAFANISYITLYTPLPNQPGYQQKQTGNLHPLATRDEPHPNFIFNLNLPPGQKQAVYLRFENSGTMRLPLTLWSQKLLTREIQTKQFNMGAYYGILLIMMVYNLFLSFFLRDKSYVLYTLFVLCFLLTSALLDGLPQYFEWPGLFLWSQYGIRFFSSLTVFFALSFTSSFLITWKHAPRLHWVIIALQVSLGVSLLLVPFISNILMIRPMLILWLLGFLTILVTSIRVWVRGYQPARYFVLAWLGLVISMALMIFARMGLLPANGLTSDSPRLGIILLILLLSLALADRINIFRREKEEAQAKILHQQKEALRLSQEYTSNLQQINETLKQSIAQREQAENALQVYTRDLERSNRELQEFAYVASHDLQEPLRKIQAFGDRLKARYADSLDDRGQDYVDRMENAANRAQKLIQDLLVFSRVTTKTQPFEPVNLNTVAQSVLENLDSQLKKLNGQVHLEDLPVIEADPNQMELLFYNLTSNALKFHRDGIAPVIKISSNYLVDENVYQITIADNGIGFEEQYSKRIFRIFQRLHSREKYQGTGVGLAVCQKIVERHDGTITAQGKPNKGATFTIALPVERN